ncbi:L-threonylcarbamoyladenylate synthase [Kribbella sp. NBC_01245]|uniref:L-threonylcarbamoyladenylate synthase n=1 Tax=Kribbella sp. NBC_01245 TaxID=2903578 RepID=UPI002E280182|nr:L-threonylcarbamoyladenylate synthase [Kribbella sp. NBC_01245]
MHCVSERYDFTGDELGPAYAAAVDAIEAGELVVLPTDTVYGLAADAFKAEAVQRLLDTKGRGRDMPPPVLISVVDTMDALATDIPEAGRELCKAFWPGPLTVICHAQTSLMWDLGETQGTVALRVPDQADTRELLSRTGPLAVSSANLSGQPAATDVYDAERQLGDAVAVYLDGGVSPKGEPSTIVDLTGDIPNVVRVGALSVEDLRKVVRRISAPGDPAPEDEPEVEIVEDANKSASADVSAPEDADAPAPDPDAKKTDVAAPDDADAKTDVSAPEGVDAKTDVSAPEDAKTAVEKTDADKTDETKPGE